MRIQTISKPQILNTSRYLLVHILSIHDNTKQWITQH